MSRYKERDRRGNRRYEHRAVVEGILGSSLPPNAEVHHVDGNPENNRPSNLVVCEDHSYHMLLHRRERALRECGHVDWTWCIICKSWGSGMSGPTAAYHYYHKSCQADRSARYRRRKA